MASRSYQWVSDFLNYLPRLASDILAEQIRKVKKEENRVNWDFQTQIYPTGASHCITISLSHTIYVETNIDNL